MGIANPFLAAAARGRLPWPWGRRRCLRTSRDGTEALQASEDLLQKRAGGTAGDTDLCMLVPWMSASVRLSPLCLRSCCALQTGCGCGGSAQSPTATYSGHCRGDSSAGLGKRQGGEQRAGGREVKSWQSGPVSGEWPAMKVSVLAQCVGSV